MKLNILGTSYTVRTGVDPAKDKGLKNRFGYCGYNDKKIVVADIKKLESWEDETESALAAQVRATLRHEIIHAFLNESGLWGSSCDVESWANNEEMVDWFALQWPKMVEAMRKAGCL